MNILIHAFGSHVYFFLLCTHIWWSIWNAYVEFFIYIPISFPGDSDSKESTCKVGDPGLILGLLTPTPRGLKTRWRRTWKPTLLFLPGESPCTEKPGRLQSMGLQRIKHDWATYLPAAYKCSSSSTSLATCETIMLNHLVCAKFQASTICELWTSWCSSWF